MCVCDSYCWSRTACPLMKSSRGATDPAKERVHCDSKTSHIGLVGFHSACANGGISFSSHRAFYNNSAFSFHAHWACERSPSAETSKCALFTQGGTWREGDTQQEDGGVEILWGQ